MGFRAASSYTNTPLNALTGGVTETVLFTTGVLESPFDNGLVILCWSLILTAGAATTFIGVLLRRGVDATGVQVSGALYKQFVAAAGQYIISATDTDSPGVAACPYTLTVQQNTGSSASTYVDGCLLAFVL